jgi:putative oxidoreductase
MKYVRQLVWIPQVALAVATGAGGVFKLTGDPAMVDMFDTIGVGQWFRYLVGVLELAGAVGLLIPRLAAFAAAGLAVLFAGAAITNVAVLDTSPILPLAYLVVAAAIAWVRRPRNGAMSALGEGRTG